MPMHLPPPSSTHAAPTAHTHAAPTAHTKSRDPRSKRKSGSESRSSKSNMENPQSSFSKGQRKGKEAHNQGAATAPQVEKTPFYRVPFLGGGTVWDFLTTFSNAGAHNSGAEQASSMAATGGYPAGSEFYH